jgi:putative membrane protein
METSPIPAKQEVPNVNDLAVDRNRLASERTLMAWLRTALSMISFGFTIYKFMQLMLDQNPTTGITTDSPRAVGLSLIGIGTFALFVAAAQHFIYVKQLLGIKRPYRFWRDLSFIVSCLLLMIGILMLAGITMRTGPFN